MSDSCIRVETIETKDIDAAYAHNDRSVMSTSVREYVVHSRTKNNDAFDYGLSAADVLAEVEANESNGHKLHHRSKPFKNFLVLFEEHHTTEDLKGLVEKVVEEFPGIRPMNLAMHRDEGHHDEITGEFKPNLHAHLIFTTNGETDNKQFQMGGRKAMQKLQDIAAEHLGMARGKPTYGKGGRLDPSLPPSERVGHVSHWQYRAAAKKKSAAIKLAVAGAENDLDEKQAALDALTSEVEELRASVRNLFQENSTLAVELGEEKTAAKKYSETKKAADAFDIEKLNGLLKQAQDRNLELEQRLADEKLRATQDKEKTLESANVFKYREEHFYMQRLEIPMLKQNTETYPDLFISAHARAKKHKSWFGDRFDSLIDKIKATATDWLRTNNIKDFITVVEANGYEEHREEAQACRDKYDKRMDEDNNPNNSQGR